MVYTVLKRENCRQMLRFPPPRPGGGHRCQHPRLRRGRPASRQWHTFVPGIILLLLVTLPVTFVHAQSHSRLELIHADVNRGQVLPSGEVVRIFEGNVQVQQDTAAIFCDRALFYHRRNTIELQGHVRIIRGRERLTAGKVTYIEPRKLAIAQQGVHLSRPGRELRAEYLEYYYETDQAYARTHLWLHDQNSHAFITAHEGEYLPGEDRAVVRGEAHFWQPTEGGEDTLHIHAREMEYRFSPERTAFARETVRIRKGELFARCDSAVYFLEQERALLKGHPVARQEGTRIVGEAMELLFQADKLQRVVVRGKALATSVEDSLAGKINKLAGKEIVALVQEDRIQELWAHVNARSVYYLKDQGEEQGVNTASADTIRIYFRDSEVDSIAVIGGAQGIFYPANYQGEMKLEL